MEKAGEAIKLDPTPGYVLKTRILRSASIQVGTKVFLNICQDPQVPKPQQDFEPGIVFPLIVDNKWEIPIIVSREKDVKDKQGQASYCYDCCINDLCLRWCTINADLRSILNEWCIEAVELLYDITLDRQYSTPKMLHKGPLSQTEIKKDELTDQGFQKKLSDLKQNEHLGLIEELKDGDTPMEEEDSGNANIDIFNSSSTKKPLIEEIDEKSKPAITSSSLSSSTPPASDYKEQVTEINYQVSFKKLETTDPYMLLVSCQSNLPYEFLRIYYEAPNLLLTSTSKSHVFDIHSHKQEVKIPLPHTPSNFKSFHVKNKTLIFC